MIRLGVYYSDELNQIKVIHSKVGSYYLRTHINWNNELKTEFVSSTSIKSVFDRYNFTYIGTFY